MALDRSTAIRQGGPLLAPANPLSMNEPPYYTIPYRSHLVTSDRPCLPVKAHLRALIELVAETYGPATDLRVLAGNVIGAGGWRDLPTQKQHEAVTGRAGAFIASGMMYLEVSGPDAERVLDHLTPRDIAALRPGQAPFTIFTSPSGGIDEEALVLRTAEDRFLVSCGGGGAPSHLHEALERYPNVTVRESDFVSFNIKGPDRLPVMIDLVRPEDQASVAALKPFNAVKCLTTAGRPVHIVRTVIGMEMWGAPETITEMWKTMLQIPERVLPCGWDLLDSYRMECEAIDFLLHPLDMNYATTLFDVGLDWMINPGKTAGYIGKTSLDAGQELPGIRTIKVAASEARLTLPQIGEIVQRRDGTPCGYVTSWGYSYILQRAVAFVHLEDGASGTDLDGWEALAPGAFSAPARPYQTCLRPASIH